MYVCQECHTAIDASEANVRVSGNDVVVNFTCVNEDCEMENDFCE